MAGSNKNGKIDKMIDWKPFATFVVEYQWIPVDSSENTALAQYHTNAHILESGENAEWDGIEGKPLMEWMLNHVVTQAQGQLSTKENPGNKPVVDFPILINLIEISITDSNEHCANCFKGGHFSGFVSHGSELVLKAVIDVQGLLTEERSRYCRTDFFAIRLADGKRRTLGSVVPEGVVNQGEKLTVVLENVVLETGVYAIRVVTVLNDFMPSLDYMEGSLLIVA